MSTPTLPDLYRSITDQAALFTAEAIKARRELGFDAAPLQAPFYLDQLDEHNVHVSTIGSLGDLREARRRRASEAFERGVPVDRISLTDRNGKAVA